LLDVIQISYNEPDADENFEILQHYAPHAKRVQGVEGIFNAHQAAAEIAETSHFYVIDADAIIEEEFTFRFKPVAHKLEYEYIPQTDCVYVWRSRNPVNDLVYGYGGAKLFPRKALLKAKDWRVDMTTSIGCPFVPKFQVSNITAFNTSSFDSWKSAFRECTKLSSSIIENGDNVDNEYRLDVWKTRGKNRPFGLECTLGAKQGADFGFHYRGQVNILNKINDFDWLHETYEEAMADHNVLTEVP
jgi:hypothetical protein